MEVASAFGQFSAFVVPVVLVLILAGVIFAFGFTSSVELPNFKYLRFSSSDKKTTKKKKTTSSKVRV